jgi:hypothetical protein
MHQPSVGMDLLFQYIAIRDIMNKSALPVEIVDIIISYDDLLFRLCNDLQNRLDKYIYAIEHFFRIHYRETKYHSDAVRRIVLYLFQIENKYIIDNDLLRQYLNDILGKMKNIMKISGYDVMRNYSFEKRLEIWANIVLYIFLINNIHPYL